MGFNFNAITYRAKTSRAIRGTQSSKCLYSDVESPAMAGADPLGKNIEINSSTLAKIASYL